MIPSRATTVSFIGPSIQINVNRHTKILDCVITVCVLTGTQKQDREKKQIIEISLQGIRISELSVINFNNWMMHPKIFFSDKIDIMTLC